MLPRHRAIVSAGHTFATVGIWQRRFEGCPLNGQERRAKMVVKYVVRLEAKRQPEAVLNTLLTRGALHVVGATLR